MNATRQELIAEGVKRMHMLQMDADCINQFAKTGEPYLSTSAFGVDAEKLLQHVPQFEAEHPRYKVFHVMYKSTPFGDLLALLLIPADRDEWPEERDLLADGYAFAYVLNLTDDFLSEFGDVVVEPYDGGLMYCG